MDVAQIFDTLESNTTLIRGIFAGVSDADQRWKPAPEKWSMLEVLGHLYDEERLDFRLRVRITLETPGEALPPVDPEVWVREHRYNERDPDRALSDFLVERGASIEWLRGLDAPRWENAFEHPRLGTLRSGDFLAAWLAHDYLHLRQLCGLRVELVRMQAAPFHIRYAAP